MREQFYNNLLMRLSGVVTEENLKIFSRAVLIELNDYELTKRVTDIVPYDRIPGCVKTYLVTRKIEGVKVSSIRQYTARLKQFFDMVDVPFEKITANDIRVWLYELQAQRQISDSTLDSARTIVCTFFKWANAEGYIPTNPCANIRPIKYNRKERQALTEEELELIRNTCTNLRDKAIIETFYSTGCRLSELLNLKITDVDFGRGEVILFGKGEKYRTSYINTKAKLAILEYLNSRTDQSPYLFVSNRNRVKRNLTKSAVERMVRNLGENAGLTRRIHPHLIRHTTATIGLQRGMDITEIQRMLGHSSLDTTMIYAHIADGDVKNSHQKYIV